MGECTSCECYAVKLANGQSWDMVAGPEASLWLSKAARILGLSKGEQRSPSKVIFVKRGLEEISDKGLLSDSCDDLLTWEVQSVGPLSIRSTKGKRCVICELGEEESFELDIIKIFQSLYSIYSQVQSFGGLPLHASLIERAGMGIAIAAPGGTGKSTCCRRIPSPWNALCDDEILVVKDASGSYHAHPFPTWSEYLRFKSERTWDVQRHVPLKGYFILEQSPNDQVIPIGKGSAAVHIYNSAFQVYNRSWYLLSQEQLKAAKSEAFDNACKMAESVPAFILKASLTGSFWKQIEEALEL